jgi:heptosyltransferase-1
VRVLVVKMSSMGDVVHAQPVIADLRAHVPGATVDWVAEAPFAGIPAMNPGVSEVIPIAWRKWRRTLREPATRAAMRTFRDRLRAHRYDWVVDCQGLVKSAAVVRLARAAHRAGPAWGSAREPIASLAYDLRADVPWSMHVVARNRAVAAAAFGYAIDAPARFGLEVPRFAPRWLADDARLAVLIPGASRPEKLWPEERWIAIGRRLAARGLQLAWLWGSPSELERVRRLAAACGRVDDASAARTDASYGAAAADAGPRPAPDAASVAPSVAADAPAGVRPVGADATSVLPPFLSVADAAGLLARAAIVVGLDTGFTHLAGALGRPTIAIFCDFDATQCAVSGDGPCASFGGIGQSPPVADVAGAIDRMLDDPAER